MATVKSNLSTENPSSNLSQNLKKILRDHDMNISDLARAINLPQSTLNQLFLGVSTSPRISTIIPIAKFFYVSVDILLGLSQNTENINYHTNVPIIEWENIKKWIDFNSDFNLFTHKQWVITDKKIDKLSFAIKSTKAMEPVFMANSVLIIDTSKTIADNSYVVCCEKNNNCKIKRVIKDGGDIFLESINNLWDTGQIKYNHRDHIIYGFIKEVRLNMIC